MKNRIVSYWSKRSHEFSQQREREQASETGAAWLDEINHYLPSGKKLNILDVGCGTGMFSLMLSKQGHQLTGIDLTEHMILHAQELARKQRCNAHFSCMDAEHLDFPDDAFDVILTRNLTWTLPDPGQAYREWFRVLKKGGILLNFDADYGHDSCNKDASSLPPTHAHCTMAREMLQECEDIKEQLSISRSIRPSWDVSVLNQIGYQNIRTDTQISSRIYKNCDEFYNPTPMFLIYAQK